MSAPGVVVVPDPSARPAPAVEYAEELAMAGFAVDVVGGPGADPVPGHGLAAAPGDADGTAGVAAAVTRLRDGGAAVVGAVGFARGGDLVLRAARDGAVDAVVAYGAVGSVPDAARTTCPVQLHLAGDDPLVARGALAAYVAALVDAGTPVDHFTYPAADPLAADAARARTVGFLHARLTR